ncbi:MAG: carboxypeptidase regulatory-like domain-containing protein [Acidobacteriia bacterium]|nr:carboxypeptidase regulatory-like domain-containing protein [Terriglobia bacterium]
MKFFTIILILAFVLPLAAQDRASINGTVTDPSGAVVTGVEVTLSSPSTGLRRETTSNQRGIYEFASLPVGSYTLSMSRQGFKPLVVSNVDLLFGQVRTVDAPLTVGATAESVQVSATAEYLNRDNAEVDGVIESPQIREIPLNGRNWATLMALAPGAINSGSGSQRDIRFDGHSLDDSNFTFDGIDASGVQEQTEKAETRLSISMDAIAEFRVGTSVYTAEQGSAGGAQINVVSKTGSNEFHGTLFDYLRNSALDSPGPFDGGVVPPFRLNQFGAQLGGPVVRNKAFFFVNFEGLDQSLDQTLIGFVPNAAFRAQVLAASPVLAPIISAFPKGTVPIDSITDQISVLGHNTVREDSGMFRFDYRFSDKSTAFVRYSIDNALINNPQDALGATNTIPVIPQNLVLQFQHIFSPTTINESKFGLNRVNYHNWNYGTSPISVSSSNFSGLGDNTLDEEVGTTFSFIDNLTMVRGRHTFKFGVDVRRIRLNNSGNAIRDSSIDYASPQDFINNSADSASVLEGEGIRGNRRTFVMGFAQDEFKVTPNLTLNIGLRYELYTVAHEILNRAAVVDINGCGGFCPVGTPFYDINPNDWGPRFGFAWAPPMLHGKTVIRGGYGIYYGGNQNDDFSDPLESAVPRYGFTSSDFANLSYPLNQFITPQSALFTPKAIDRHRKDLSYQSYNLLIQQQLPGKFQLQAGYQGSVGHHLFDRYTVNLINPATGKRPLSQFSSFGFKANDANDNFNALQVSLERRFTGGFLWQTQYMWSHGIADASIGAGESVSFQDQACRACDRSSMPYDIRHTMTSNAIYQLPFGQGHRFLNQDGLASKFLGGWELSGIATARTGMPINITLKRATSALPDGNNSNQRPNLVPGVPLYAANQSITNWFNPAAFAIPAKGTWGNLGRYAARGPGYSEFDMALQKAFPIGETIKLNFRTEVFNIFNQAIYANPSGSIGSDPADPSASFGRITSVLNTGAVGTGTPRRIQFALRLDF